MAGSRKEKLQKYKTYFESLSIIRGPTHFELASKQLLGAATFKTFSFIAFNFGPRKAMPAQPILDLERFRPLKVSFERP